MGDFQLSYRPRQIRLLDQRLTLDPDIIRMMGEIEAQMAARRIISDMLRPNWNLVLPDFQSILNAAPADLFRPPPSPPTSVWAVPRGAGPTTPRAGELSDVTGAIYKLPVVQGLVERAHDEGFRQLRLLRSDWNNASTGERITMVTMATVVAGAFITPIIANQQTRDLAFGLIKDRDISVPGVTGLSFRLLDRGGGFTAPLGVPGLTGSARLQFPNSAAPNYEMSINFDLMEFIRSRSSR